MKFLKVNKAEWLQENRRYLPLLFFGSLGLSVILVLLYLFIGDVAKADRKISAMEYLSSFFGAFLYVLIIPLCVINLIYLVKKIHFFNYSSKVLLGLKIAALIVGVSLGTYICWEILTLLENLNLKDKNVFSFQKTPIGLFYFIIFNNIFGLIIVLPGFIRTYKKKDIDTQLQEKEIELNHLQQVQTKAQLELLQTKINPHFLYNSLNSIASLAYEDPDKVEKMAISLSKLFRYSMNTSADSFSTLKDEIELVKTYLEIEKIRFGDKLSFEINMQADESIVIPRFLIQPLIENSIKHGISKIIEPGKIKISIIQDNERLEISIGDNGPRFPEKLMAGYGLQSTQEKLNLLFAGNYEISIINEVEKQIKITLNKIITHEPTV